MPRKKMRSPAEKRSEDLDDDDFFFDDTQSSSGKGKYILKIIIEHSNCKKISVIIIIVTDNYSN